MNGESRELFDAEPVRPAILEKVLLLPPPEMKIVLHFLSAKKTSDGTVFQTGMAIAEKIKMNRSQYAREIKDVVAAGWVEFSCKEQNIPYYRLGPTASDETNGLEGGSAAVAENAKILPFRREAS
ncbi:hypothetical protein ACFW1A_40270 [Kitasatospora sp. NPDC058965]|uniref:hypothetical protein n=1 Tax=Kitasatospora sp. NPDC058965 TaxID=3346682 RepID=UPI00368987F8